MPVSAPLGLFVGEHDHSIDGKNRLILPSKFRSGLAGGAYITALDDCLAIFPPSEFEIWAQNLQKGVNAGEVDVNAFRKFASDADWQMPDSQGRIRLQSRLRDAAGIERKVIVTGAIRRIEVWRPDRWAEVREAGTESLTEAITHGRGMGDA